MWKMLDTSAEQLPFLACSLTDGSCWCFLGVVCWLRTVA